MYDVLIVGAGPAGLAAAIAAQQRGLRYLVIEKGVLVHSLHHFPPDMIYFTTPELLEIGGMPFVSPHEKPTRQESLKYYRKVTDAYRLEIALEEPVSRVAVRPDGTFGVTSAPKHGPEVVREARSVVLATGAYDVANRLDVPGEDLPHVSHYYHGPHQHYRQRVVIVGGKNSAAEAALDLFRNGAAVTLIHRGAALGDSIKYWVKPDIENRITEGSIAARFNTHVTEITRREVLIEGPDGADRLPADAVLLLTGYRADTTLMRAAGIGIEPAAEAPIFNPDTLETNVPGLYVVGACVAGRASGRVFIENGRLHGEIAIQRIAAGLGHPRSVRA
jgi:thioredoxin reductase (NADPH)